VGRLLREGLFDELYVQPAAGDAGGALGAALHVWHHLLGHPRDAALLHGAWGEAHDDRAIGQAAGAAGFTPLTPEDDASLISRTVELLMAGRVVAWFDGRFEWGPRALGHRSLLADPRHAHTRDRVNRAVKFREAYRPFGVSIAAAYAPAVCGIADPDRSWTGRFMQMVTPVRETARPLLEAVTHVNGTTRPHLVFPDVQPRYHQLLTTFGEASGVPALLNTSFNVRGEPIVNTPAEALATFSQSAIDAMVMGRALLVKPQ
jgi:carbamoyltransferase